MTAVVPALNSLDDDQIHTLCRSLRRRLVRWQDDQAAELIFDLSVELEERLPACLPANLTMQVKLKGELAELLKTYMPEASRNRDLPRTWGKIWGLALSAWLATNDEAEERRFALVFGNVGNLSRTESTTLDHMIRERLGGYHSNKLEKMTRFFRDGLARYSVGPIKEMSRVLIFMLQDSALHAVAYTALRLTALEATSRQPIRQQAFRFAFEKTLEEYATLQKYFDVFGCDIPTVKYDGMGVLEFEWVKKPHEFGSMEEILEVRKRDLLLWRAAPTGERYKDTPVRLTVRYEDISISCLIEAQ